MVHGESRHVEHHIINGPDLFHPGSAMLHRELAEPEHRRDGAPLMGDEDAINVSVVADAAPYGGLPEHRIIVLRWDPCEVRVFEVYEEPTLLAKVTVENVPYHFCGTLAPFNHRRTIR